METSAIKAAAATVEEFRQLVRVVKVDDIIPHPNATAMELAIIGGWQCCVKIGEFTPGSLALYCEIDSMLPITYPDFAFLEMRKENLRQVGEKVYARIKTIRLRGEISQGLLIPIPPDHVSYVKEGDDLTAKLGVLKYASKSETADTTVDREPTSFERFCLWLAGGPIPTLQLDWPSFLTKSEEPRVQNIHSQYLRAVEEEERFQVSYKLDGASITAWVRKRPDGEYDFGVASRNAELSQVDIIWTPFQSFRRWLAQLLLSNRRMLRIKRFFWPRWKRGVFATEDLYVKYALDVGLKYTLMSLANHIGKDVAIQGELCGPGIQNNFEQLEDKELFIYRVFTSSGGVFEKELPDQAATLVAIMGMTHIPVAHENVTLPPTVKECVAMADGPGAFKEKGYREGFVYKSLTRHFSFKVISNSYLLKVED